MQIKEKTILGYRLGVHIRHAALNITRCITVTVTACNKRLPATHTIFYSASHDQCPLLSLPSCLTACALPARLHLMDMNWILAIHKSLQSMDEVASDNPRTSIPNEARTDDWHDLIITWWKIINNLLPRAHNQTNTSLPIESDLRVRLLFLQWTYFFQQ